jgi:hypothetical protein
MPRQLKKIEFGGSNLGPESWAAAVQSGQLQLDSEVIGWFDDGSGRSGRVSSFAELRQLFPGLIEADMKGASDEASERSKTGRAGAREVAGADEWQPVPFPSAAAVSRVGTVSDSPGPAPLIGDDRPWAEDLAVRDVAIAALRRDICSLIDRVGDLRSQLITSEYRVRSLETALRQVEGRQMPSANVTASTPSPMRSTPLATGFREERSSLRTASAWEPPMVDRPAAPPMVSPPSATASVSNASAFGSLPPPPAFVPPALSEYLSLLGGGKPRQFASFFSRFADVRSLHMKNDEAMADTFTGNDAEELLVALQDQGRYWVVPTYDYVSVFPTVFSDTIKNPKVISSFFTLEPDGSGRLSLLAPAMVQMRDKSQVELVNRGRLSGFLS